MFIDEYCVSVRLTLIPRFAFKDSFFEKTLPKKLKKHVKPAVLNKGASFVAFLKTS